MFTPFKFSVPVDELLWAMEVRASNNWRVLRRRSETFFRIVLNKLTELLFQSVDWLN